MFDQNLPHQFTISLADLFPASLHVKDAGLATAGDRQIWDYAGANRLAIISKDADFHQLSFLLGAPPKTIWLRCGNCDVATLESIIRARSSQIEAFLKDSEGALLVVDEVV